MYLISPINAGKPRRSKRHKSYTLLSVVDLLLLERRLWFAQRIFFSAHFLLIFLSINIKNERLLSPIAIMCKRDSIPMRNHV